MNQKKEPIPYEKLTLTNDFLFCKVFTTYDELLKNLIHLVTGEDIEGFVEVNNQKSIGETIDGKGIRCDVYAIEKGKRTVYDIEMQTTTRRDLPRRVRYYQSAIDNANLDKGRNYTELPNSYIVFICTDSLFGSERQYFKFSSCDDWDPSIRLGDGATEIFLTTKGNDKSLSKELKGFLDYLDRGISTSDFTRDLEKAVSTAKQNQIWREEYKMKSLVEFDAHDEGLKEGRLKAIALVLHNGGEEAAERYLNASKQEILEAKEWAKNNPVK